MLEQLESFAQKYAQAFLNLYSRQLSDVVMHELQACDKFLVEHKSVCAYLSLSSISFDLKNALIEKICTAFQLPSSIEKLSKVLLKKGRIELLPAIIQKIILGNLRQQNIMNFVVSTSHAIDDQEKEALISFIEKQVSHAIVVNFIVDPSLICGIKIKSDELLWERSIAKQLKTIKREALQRVQL